MSYSIILFTNLIFYFLEIIWTPKIFNNFLGGGQNLERRNVEQSIFRNFKITNIKITKEISIILFSNLIFHFLEII